MSGSSKESISSPQSWEDLLDSSDEETTLTEEVQKRMHLRQLELDENTTSAIELFEGGGGGEPSHAVVTSAKPLISASSGSGSYYSIDSAKPRSKEEMERFERAVISKLMSLQHLPFYSFMISHFIRSLAASSFPNPQELKKVVSELQTLLNEKWAASKATPSSTSGSVTQSLTRHAAKPTLKKSSLKTAFDHDVNTKYDETDELNDFDDDDY
jgi:Translation initiation factor eIF3 subunit